MNNLENIILSTISQSQKNENTVCFHLYDILLVFKIIVIGSKMVVARARRKGSKGYYLTGLYSQFYNMKTVIEMNAGNGCTLL